MSKQSDFITKMHMPYEFKRAYAEIRVKEFITECAKQNKNTFVSVGGLDSITLLTFIHSLGFTDVPGVSVSAIEDKSVRAVHRALGVIDVKPQIDKYHIVKRFGFPLFSKETARKISTLQNPTEKNAGYRHAILTGETTQRAKQPTSKITKLPRKYLELYNAGVFNNMKISDKCCLYMKERPIAQWAKEHNAFPFLGLQASESNRRFRQLSNNGCNYFNGASTRSAPFAIFNKSDVLQLAIELKVPIPEAYGVIGFDRDGTLYTTKTARTGCDICAFGIQFEKTRPNRFDKLHDTDVKKWRFWLYDMGYGELFNRIGYKWEQPYIYGENTWGECLDIVEY